MVEIAYFATGCFWGAERRFWSLHGVLETSVGYMGGSKEDPTYEVVCTGRTGHAEMVQVTFDQEKISYEELLKEFWTMHDPTTLNAQGNDIGSQYRSSIYTTSEAQNELATKTRNLYAKEISKVGYGEIVTEILPATNDSIPFNLRLISCLFDVRQVESFRYGSRIFIPAFMPLVS